MESNQQMANQENASHHEVMQAGVGFDKQEPHSLMIAGLGISSIVSLVVIILGLQAYFEHVKDQQVNEQVLVPQADDIKQLRLTEEEALHNYKYVDKDKGIVQISVERAMELIAKEAAEGKLQYSSKEYPVKAPGDASAQTNATGSVTNGGSTPEKK